MRKFGQAHRYLEAMSPDLVRQVGAIAGVQGIVAADSTLQKVVHRPEYRSLPNAIRAYGVLIWTLKGPERLVSPGPLAHHSDEACRASDLCHADQQAIKFLLA